MKTFVRSFGFSSCATLIGVLAAVYFLGFNALLPLAVLIIIEVTFSFDNAIVNAKVLQRLSPLWQKLFLSIGIIVAIFGMRLLFPILMVALTAHISWHQVVDLALNHPTAYATKLELAHPTISAFGGAFLAMLSLHFFMSENKQQHWFERLEQPLTSLGKWWLPGLISTFVVLLLAWSPANLHPDQTLKAGILGILVYLSIHGITLLIDRLLARPAKTEQHYVGWAAFAMFCYLEILDASFSFDGVLGAFAITNKVLLIVVGLGIGAVWVRSLTVYMVRRGTLQAYRFLEHGAHYAIAVLAAAMLLSAVADVPEAVTGLVGLGFIIGSVFASKSELS